MWRVLYKTKDGHKVIVTTLMPPEKYRIFRIAGKPGRRKFKAVKIQELNREVIFVASTKSKNTKKKGKAKEEVVTDDELEELEDLEELDEDEEEEDEDVESDDDDEEEEEDDEEEDDEDEDEDEDDDEEDEDEEPAPKKKSKSKKSKSSDDGKIGSKEIAEYCGVDSRRLRMVLRSKKGASIRKEIQDPDTKQYRVSSVKHPAVKKLKKLIDSGAADEATKESLDKLKKSKNTGKKKSSSKGKKRSKKSSDDDE